jgi:isopentenyl diphosphate isomerase/L-lactate dehydrogenase-like FMN-dependent dehydrogenase
MHNIADLRRAARRRLPRMVFDFIDGGATDEVTLRANSEDFAAITLRPRMAVDVTVRDLSTTVLGHKLSVPLILSPTGLTGLTVPKGERSAAAAATAAGTIYCLSSNASTSIEEVAEAAGKPYWFQLYIMRDRALTRSLLERAKAVGCSAIIITVDLQAHGRRERDLRNGFTVPPRVDVANALDFLRRPGWLWRMATGPRISFANFANEAGTGFLELARRTATALDPGLTWKDIGWCKSIYDAPVLVKGILTGSDARLAIQHGADGIIVSNHGGRQLDGVSSSIAALPEVVDAVAGQVPVLLDGGVRRGADIVRAKALGAAACMIGRPFLYGLAALGPTGAAAAIDILRTELDNAMALLGQPSFAAIDASVIERPARMVTTIREAHEPTAPRRSA